MRNLLVVFSHVKEFGPWGSKLHALSKVAVSYGAQVSSVNYCEYPAGTMHDYSIPGKHEHCRKQLLNTALTPHDK